MDRLFGKLKKGVWVEFLIYPSTESSLKAKYYIPIDAISINDVIIKLVSKIGRSYYYSVLNHAGEEFDNILKQAKKK